MYKLAFYGKGGIGKSTTASNVSAALADKGLKVLQIGCDPKADSTLLLLHGQKKKPVLDLLRDKGQATSLEDMVTEGYGGVLCVEAGGPKPGSGCAGRGIIAALDYLQKKEALEVYQPDVIIFDVLGDVVCGGFAMPIREGYADQVFILTSGEAMSTFAARNIALAVDQFQERGYASLGGVVWNKKNIPNEEANIQKLCQDIGGDLVGSLERSDLVQQATGKKKTVVEAFPDSAMAQSYRDLADRMVLAAKKDRARREQDA